MQHTLLPKEHKENLGAVEMPQAVVRYCSQRFPRGFKDLARTVENIKRSPHAKMLNGHPACGIPSVVGYALVASRQQSFLGRGLDPTEEALALTNGSIFTAVANWRLTKGVYRVSKELWEDLASDPEYIYDGFPLDDPDLYDLPEFCLYIVHPESSPVFYKAEYLKNLVTSETIVTSSGLVHGYFVMLDYDPGHERDELLIIPVLHSDDESGFNTATPVIINVGAKTLRESEEISLLREALEDRKHAPKRVLPVEKFGKQSIRITATTVLPILKYICSAIKNERPHSNVPRRPAGKKTKHGMKYTPVNIPTEWELGYFVGPDIPDTIDKTRQDGKGTHASPRPHVRRAHYHHFWTGSEKDGNRVLVRRWIRAILVNAEGEEQIIPTIRRAVAK